jgi:23S rRNA (pseudouridine1915-N3)-methyltransferase
VRFTLLVVGRPRHTGLADAIADYESRAARYWPLDVFEVREESSRSMSPDLVRERESERLLDRLPGAAKLVTCEPGGDSMTSEGFALFLQRLRERGEGIAFAIGGAHGLGNTIRTRSTRRLSLAPWTLPHELARLVLAEQLYRAGTIQRGEPYHK